MTQVPQGLIIGTMLFLVYINQCISISVNKMGFVSSKNSMQQLSKKMNDSMISQILL